MVGAIHNTSASSTNGAAALRTLTDLGRRLDAQDPRVVRQAATQMLSQLFFAPLLASMREFPLGRELATGGRMESAFGEQLDQRLADAVAGSSRGLVQSMTRYIEQGASATSAAMTPGQDRAAWPVQTQTSVSAQKGVA